MKDIDIDFKRGDKGSAGYHYSILINGEHRATWRKDAIHRGYRLVEPGEGHSIYRLEDRDHYVREVEIECEKQEDFLGTTSALLREGLIPTIAELEERRALREANDIDTKQVEELRARAWKIEKAAMDMYEALGAACWLAYNGDTKNAARILLDRGQVALNIANGTIVHKEQFPKTIKLRSGRAADIKKGSCNDYELERNRMSITRHRTMQISPATLRLALREEPRT